MILLRRDPTTGKYLCPKCCEPMTRTVRPNRSPQEVLECPDQVCGHIEPLYTRRDEGEP